MTCSTRPSLIHILSLHHQHLRAHCYPSFHCRTHHCMLLVVATWPARDEGGQSTEYWWFWCLLPISPQAPPVSSKVLWPCRALSAVILPCYIAVLVSVILWKCGWAVLLASNLVDLLPMHMWMSHQVKWASKLHPPAWCPFHDYLAQLPHLIDFLCSLRYRINDAIILNYLHCLAKASFQVLMTMQGKIRSSFLMWLGTGLI